MLSIVLLALSIVLCLKQSWIWLEGAKVMRLGGAGGRLSTSNRWKLRPWRSSQPRRPCGAVREIRRHGQRQYLSVAVAVWSIWNLRERMDAPKAPMNKGLGPDAAHDLTLRSEHMRMRCAEVCETYRPDTGRRTTRETDTTCNSPRGACGEGGVEAGDRYCTTLVSASIHSLTHGRLEYSVQAVMVPTAAGLVNYYGMYKKCCG